MVSAEEPIRLSIPQFYTNPWIDDYVCDFNNAGLEFQWSDGIFSIALSQTKPDGYRTAFFHPMASRGEFTVSTRVLRNKQLASRRTHGNDFKFIGQRGPDSQSGNHHFDAQTKVMFFAEMQKNAISCWNIRDPLKGSNIHIVAQNNSTMIYPVDLTVGIY
jgi:dopachrome tautomerase